KLPTLSHSTLASAIPHLPISLSLSHPFSFSISISLSRLPHSLSASDFLLFGFLSSFLLLFPLFLVSFCIILFLPCLSNLHFFCLHCHFFSLALFLSLSHSLTHTHTHAHTHSLTHTHTHAHTHTNTKREREGKRVRERESNTKKTHKKEHSGL